MPATGSVRSVYAGGDRIKVAVIATLDDMGSMPSLFNKLDVTSRAEAVARAGTLGLLQGRS